MEDCPLRVFMTVSILFTISLGIRSVPGNGQHRDVLQEELPSSSKGSLDAKVPISARLAECNSRLTDALNRVDEQAACEMATTSLRQQIHGHPASHPNSNIECEGHGFAFRGLAGDEYKERAKFVFVKRAALWTTAGTGGSPCNLPGQRCSLNLVCVGPEGRKKCLLPLALNSQCDSMYKVCKAGLSCQDGYCRQESHHNEKCNPGVDLNYHYAKCADGFFCDPFALVCQPRRKIDQYCTSVYKCQDNLVCDMDVCRRASLLSSFRDKPPFSRLRRTIPFNERRSGNSGAQLFPTVGIECVWKGCGLLQLTFAQGWNPDMLTTTQVLTTYTGDNADSISCPAHMVVNTLFCKGRRCARLALGCAYMGPTRRVVGTVKMETKFVSQKRRRVMCARGYFMQGISCKGPKCNKIKLKCVKVQYYSYTFHVKVNIGLSEACDTHRKICARGLVCKKNRCVRGWICNPWKKGSCPKRYFCSRKRKKCLPGDGSKRRCRRTSDCALGLVCDLKICRTKKDVKRFRNLTFKRNNLMLTILFNENSGGSSGFQFKFIAGMQCERSYCARKRLLVSAEFRRRMDMGTFDKMTKYISSTKVKDGSVSCQAQMVVNSVFCKRKNCAKVALGCSRPNWQYRIDENDIRETSLVSENSGEAVCPSGYFLKGISCKGVKCGFLQLKCIRIDVLV